jgi:predicted helicase
VECNPFGVEPKTIACGIDNEQHFLNTVYERFFQGYSVKTVDPHGIVYTPQPVVDFMCTSVEEVLKSEFGLTLGSLSEENVLWLELPSYL